MYAHHLSQASWAGARIIQGQWTPQAERIYDLLIMTFSESGHLGDMEGLKQKAGLSSEEWEDLLQYTSQVGGHLAFPCSIFTFRSDI
jgi:dipeptidyl-peptidase-3